MPKIPSTPAIVADFAAANPRRLRALGRAVALLALAWVAADWAFRFGYFRWQEKWMPREQAAATAGPAAAAAERETVLPGGRGAGLTRFVPDSLLAAPYEEFHPAERRIWDARGYPNADWSPGKAYDIALVGDSFTLSLGRRNLGEAIAEASGRALYHHGRPATGPMWIMGEFLRSRPLDVLPPVVVWTVTARDMSAAMFTRQPLEAWFRAADAPRSEADATEAEGAPRRAGVRWDLLSPRSLERDLPATSMSALLARKAWRAVRLRLFGVWPEEVLPVARSPFGPMLFYGENLKMLARFSPETDCEGVCNTIQRLSDWFAAKGTRLVVVLVPEKEQVYRDILPPREREAMGPGVELLAAVAAELERREIGVVDLYPAFREATARGERVYWRDDTHWNDAGIAIAAQAIADRLLPHSPPGSCPNGATAGGANPRKNRSGENGNSATSRAPRRP